MLFKPLKCLIPNENIFPSMPVKCHQWHCCCFLCVNVKDISEQQQKYRFNLTSILMQFKFENIVCESSCCFLIDRYSLKIWIWQGAEKQCLAGRRNQNTCDVLFRHLKESEILSQISVHVQFAYIYLMLLNWLFTITYVRFSAGQHERQIWQMMIY